VGDPSFDEDARRLADSLLARGAGGIRRVRFRRNRTRLLSVSRDGSTLYMDEAFRCAPPEILDAIAVFLVGRRDGAGYREAVAAIRRWVEPHRLARLSTANGAGDARALRRAARPGPCCATPEQRRFLRELYRVLNREHFDGRLPEDVPIRLARRMSRRLGHVRYERDGDGRRRVVEMALNPDLLLEGNEAGLRDTVLHEMAHIEAWVVYGHRGHGAPWKRIALRVGCEPRACTRAPIRRRAPGAATPTRVPSAAVIARA